ncbi:MAG: sulfatase-like hydrolase/transferase, partial [Verrucomicrobiota bacterium]|nr:sulfatase-like hydrolase/transferase [Verrucomicrobiota bacterium]
MRFPVVLFLLLTLLPVVGRERPHVLFLAVDDLNDWIGCLKGHPQAHTPNMDRLAARGVLFTNAHCVAPACNPSRAAVFSGRRPGVTGVWSNQSGSLARRYPQARLLSTAFA